MPRREYFVIDGKGFISGGDEPDAFGSLTKAMNRAEELARSEPGHTVVVAETMFWLKCPSEKPAVQIRSVKRKRKPNANEVILRHEGR
jgi:hypothetical protein